MVQVRVIEKDPNLPHQIIIGQGPNINQVSVSCNCWRTDNRGGYRPMANVLTGEGAIQKLWDIYNIPSNHNPHVEFPFHPDIDWGEKKTMEIK